MTRKEIYPTAAEEIVSSSGDMVELVSNPKGWRWKDVHAYPLPPMNFEESDAGSLAGARAYTEMLRSPLGDFNGEKLSLREIALVSGHLKISYSETDYFTLWGMPAKAPSLMARGMDDLCRNGKTDVPFGIYVALTVLLTGKDEPKLVTIVQSENHGFHPGKISLIEEQMEPADIDTFFAASRGATEEAGIYYPSGGSLLLGVAVHKSIPYVAFNHLLGVSVSEEEFKKHLWPGRTDPGEGIAVSCIPISKINNLRRNPDLHPSTHWRLDLLEKYLKESGIK
ncbi:MAG: hypothetical protein UX13_C0001G0027 [Candidatus Woesebacteria bacterium GW2011_GWB1_45_5]|uniref:Nudix hydrolase domain-containing protein n=1 Tax=Candidatus Woesebacteria bacterium GW2011_GWB1_45_5 TaxID=1618581 RepID=A0A0G1MRG3_9BACT|nr:MAG: hypothetical protein UX13_C0001G0027 [Candidatus Woesebacteria bacterium GW2011_GWB1_45_5]